MPHLHPTQEQVVALHDDVFAGVFPRPEAQRPSDQALIVSLPYSLNPRAEPQGYALIKRDGSIHRDHIYSYKLRAFRPDPQLYGLPHGPGDPRV
jgi:hypothetical protein